MKNLRFKNYGHDVEFSNLGYAGLMGSCQGALHINKGRKVLEFQETYEQNFLHA